MMRGSHGREVVRGDRCRDREREDGLWRVRPVRMGRSRVRMLVALEIGMERARAWFREMLAQY